MCEPATIAMAASAAATVGGTVVGGIAGQQDAKQQAAFARMNAAMARQAATDATVRGEQAATQARMEGTRTISEARVAQGASGIDMSSGSSVDALATSRFYSELDAETLRNNAAREARGLKIEEYNYQMQEKAIRSGAKYRLAGTVLTGVGQVANTIGGPKGIR